MHSLSAEKFLTSAIKWLVFLTLLTPLIISSSTLFPYVFGKAIAFQILAELMLVCYAWLLYYSWQRTGSIKNYLPKFNLLFWAIAAFFIILILSTIFSVDFSYSFWSKQERMDGLFNLLHYFAFFFILSGAIKQGRSWLQILDASVIISFFASLYALGQQFNFIFNPYPGRLTGTLGNASFLATYLLFNIAFAIVLFSQRKNTNLRIWYGLVVAMEIIILILTQTRGALIGLLGGFFILSFGYCLFASPSKNKKYVWALIILILLSGTILFGAKNSTFVKNSPLLNRFTNISFKTDTGRIRLVSWKIGLSAFLEKPLLGWGQENYYVAFNKHLNPDFFTYSGETFDRAHNKIIDVLVMNGFLGLTAYLSIFIAAAIGLWLRRKQDFIIPFALISALGVYFIQNIVLFDMPVSYLMFFLALALVYFVIRPEGVEPAPPKKRQSSILPTAYVWLATILILVFLFIGNLSPLLASWGSIEAQKILATPDKNISTLKLASEKYSTSLSHNTFTNPETNKILPPIFLSAVSTKQISPTLKNEILLPITQQLDQSIKEMPLFYDCYLNLTDIYNTLGIENSAYLKNGEETMKKLLEIYPKTPQFYYKLIINRLLAQDLNSARDMAEKSIRLNPRLPDGWWYLGITYYYAGDYNLAKENAEKSIKSGYGFSNLNNLLFLGELYDKLKDYEKALSYYQHAANLSPLDPQIQLNIAKDYKELGQIEKAKELAEKLLASSTPQTAPAIKDFLNSLK